ncbi:NYN domain-containing protein [Glycomyces xiaoerkulensis]|uniref:NYN domain-containing protein n=1 Tax=Glycomyces xiaoerkulensis TaxID=2038139 RepID=UPI000C26ACA1|nr:NYN domain-containing protein [Glycomyces xiaoerkulensis]
MTSGDDGSESGDESEPAVVFLTEPVRRRTVEIAAAAMPGLPQGRVPAKLRRYLKFNPAKRAKLARTAIANELADDDRFRAGLAEVLASTDAPLVKALREGEEISAMSDPAEVAALAYLLRTDGWERVVAASAEAIQEEAGAAPGAERADPRLEQRLAAAEKENRKLRGALNEQRSAASRLQEDLRRARRELREAEERAEKAAGDLAAERGRLRKSDSERRAERRRLEAEAGALRDQLEGLRRADRESDRLASSRLWLLMETLTGTASGLRRELGLDPVDERPAEYVAEERCAEPDTREDEGSRGLEPTDPQRLDHLLSLPNPHLIVDGYNVTMSAWGDTLTLEQQRNRLVQALGAIAAQTNAEITVVFDGSDPIFGAKPSARGVRVLFSAKGEIADDVVVDLARVEPKGRPVVVVSSDREVAERARRHDAYAAPSEMLVKRIQRL